MKTVPVRLIVTPTGNGSEVYVDGVRLENVRAFTLSRVGIDALVTLTVEFVNVAVEVEGEVADVTTLRSIARQHEPRP